MKTRYYRILYVLFVLVLPFFYNRYYYWSKAVRSGDLYGIDIAWGLVGTWLIPALSGLLGALTVTFLLFLAQQIWDTRRGFLFTAFFPAIQFVACGAFLARIYIPGLSVYFAHLVVMREYLFFYLCLLALLYILSVRRKKKTAADLELRDDGNV